MNMLMDFAKKKIPMKEMEIETIYFDNNEGSHFNTVKDSWRIYKEIFKFSGSSILAFGVDYGLYSIFNLLTGGSRLVLCNVSARVISASVNYLVNRNLVFKDKGSAGKSAVKYFALAVIILALNTGILWCLTNAMGINLYVAKLITEVLLFFFSYYAQKKAVFTNNTLLNIKGGYANEK